MDLSPFAPIDPCGYPGLAVTDLRRQGVAVDRDTLVEGLVHHLMERLHG
jgi:lipoyl(octanoyl) transferase